ncbi:GNAT family N-acetyltransferase [Sinorhizobium sp. BG8]|uniref:GNAT family N-acetyltransferase n=1 Tax=Sinorhizobium sp. BG8 TaxID=2613773 RepID=UPI00193C93F7|nr:GNAT family N-acetyltransferase [Sinorhizobium sp. BG8]QRM55926.1 GNAT family N-acetyltransferase [Sinorhizobium sp. BG8]
MSGYFGTDMQQRLQAQAEASVEFVWTTPGACQTGRTMGCDDPDRLGWPVIDRFLDRDGIFGFRMLPNDKVADLKARLAERHFRFDSWNVFVADRASAIVASKEIVDRGLPAGLVDLASPTAPDDEYTVRIQTLMAASGVVPFSGSMLVGALGPATTGVVGTPAGDPVATAHGYLAHNSFSPYHGHAWGGMVAVAEPLRGQGLGNYINARMILSVFHDLDATHVYELVSDTNIPSRRMVEACGLTLDPALVCGIAMPDESARYTR